MRRRLLATLLAALLAAGPAAATAQQPRAGFQRLYDEYRRSGVIGGCSYREADLRAALAGIPADVEAYEPGFADALNVGLEQHAAGCARGPPEPAEPATATIVAADGSPGPAIAPARAPIGAAEADTSMPIPLIALAALAGLALLLGGALALTTPNRGRPRLRRRP